MATSARLDLSGVFIPATSPFDPVSGDLDVVGLRANVRRWSGTGVKGIVIGGSTGEAMLLDDEERLAALDATAGVLPDGVLLVAGTGAESTRRTVRLTREAAAHGAHAVLVQPPAFYKGAMTPEALLIHYTAVAEASPVPVIIYQVPLRLSTLDLPTGLVAELSKHPNVIGIKDSRGQLDLVGDLVSQTVTGFQVLVGSGAHLYASLEVGAVGGILGVANLAPRESAAICAAFARGDHAEAGRIQKEVGPVHVEIVGGLGVPGVKASLDLLGYRGGDPRPPLRPLPDRGRETAHKVLRAAGLLEPDRVRA
ncbi:MAG: dihydrodipicolinate synthase family protein [Gemmatimonadota bacterium]